MRIVRRLAFAIALMVPASVFAQTSIGPGIKLASFSPQRAFAESVQGKAAIARLTALQGQKAREIEEKNKALETLEAQRSKEVETFRVNVQRFIQDAQTEVLGVQRDLESAFLVKLKPALEQVAKDSGLALVFSLDEPAIVWADPALDITGDVVKQLARLEGPPGR